jgi:hypothetical protein
LRRDERRFVPSAAGIETPDRATVRRPSGHDAADGVAPHVDRSAAVGKEVRILVQVVGELESVSVVGHEGAEAIHGRVELRSIRQITDGNHTPLRRDQRIAHLGEKSCRLLLGERPPQSVLG